MAFSKPWKEPRVVGPENPKLYTLAVETLSEPGGKRLDLLGQRFGFRESWVDKDRLYFNGVPVRLKGSTCQGGGGVNVAMCNGPAARRMRISWTSSATR